MLARAGWLRRQPARRLLLLPAVFAGIGAAIVAVVLVPKLGDGRERADCATFTIRRDDWTSQDPDVRLRSAEAIDRCDVLRGMTATEVEQRLGPPARLPPAADSPSREVWSYAVRDRLDEDDGPTDLWV